MIVGSESGGTSLSSSYTEVANFSLLPDASTVSGKIYVVLTTTGVIYINRKLAGMYKSNGTTWDYLGDITSYVNTIGGTAGQVLSKIDGTDFNTQWVTPPDTSNMTAQGNTFNGASQLVKLDATGKLPAVDGSNLINLPSGGGSTFWTPKVKSGLWTNFRNGGSISTGGAFNTGAIVFSPFNIFQAHTITDVAVKLSSTTALDLKIVIYSSDATNPLLINLVYESVVISATTTAGTYSTTLPTPLVLDPTKLYWMGVTSSNSNYRGDWLDVTKGAAPIGYFVGSIGNDWALNIAGIRHTLAWGSPIPSQIELNTVNANNTGISISMKVQ